MPELGKEKGPLTCVRPECNSEDTKVYRVRLPGRNGERKLPLCKPHGRFLDIVAEWSDDTPEHERRKDRRRPLPGRFLTEELRLQKLPLYDE